MLDINCQQGVVHPVLISTIMHSSARRSYCVTRGHVGSGLVILQAVLALYRLTAADIGVDYQASRTAAGEGVYR
jgi:hypothetical protein